jgi:hypothetical protein
MKWEKSNRADTKKKTKRNKMDEKKEQLTPNRRLAKVAVQCTADTFVVNQSFVLRINICGKNRHLRKAPKC